MKPTHPLAAALAALSLAAAADTFLRLDGGVERYSSLDTSALPAAVAEPLRERMLADGWAPYESAPRPPDTWCTTFVRSLVRTNGVWRESWVEASVPVSLDRARLVGTLLALPGGTNLLSAALASEPVAAWFAGEPTYIRGSVGAAAVAAALGIDSDALETIVAIATGNAPAQIPPDASAEPAEPPAAEEEKKD